MKDLFDALVSGGENAVLSLVRARQQESVTLEFKSKSDPSHSRLEKVDKRNLGKALSAFANSQGGLQIWGIDARREPDDDVDCARAPKLIAEIERFKSEVVTMTGELLAPRHDDISVEAVPSSAVPGAGFLLVRVERSERRPHMSRAPDDGRYYRRAGGSTFPMEHGDIEDAFSRRRIASVQPVHEWRGHGTATSGDRVTYILNLALGLRNTDLVTARFPYLHIHRQVGVSREIVGIDRYGNLGIKQAARIGDWYRFSGGADDVVHPDDTLWVVGLQVELIRDSRTGMTTLEGRPVEDAEVAFLARYGCLDAPMRTEQVRIPASQLPLPA